MFMRQRSAGLVIVVLLASTGCSEPTNNGGGEVVRPSQHVVAEQSVGESAGSALSAWDLLNAQLVAMGQIVPQSTPPTCTIVRAYSPSLNFDRTAKIGNCGSCTVGAAVLAVATAGVGAPGNVTTTTARCSGATVAGPTSAADPGSNGVNLNASAGLQVAGVPECVRSYSGISPPSNRSFLCIFF